MTDQLVLIDSGPAWRMDSSTRELGIRGVARAREALLEARARVRVTDEDDDGDREESDPLPSAA